VCLSDLVIFPSGSAYIVSSKNDYLWFVLNSLGPRRPTGVWIYTDKICRKLLSPLNPSHLQHCSHIILSS
jgi:hypothetical protein